MNTSGVGTSGKLPALDGWRAISILLVLGTHLLPLGLHEWKINAVTGISGMAIFFVLSGFLITRLLLVDQRVRPFLVRRFSRVLPLYLLYVVLVLWLNGADAEEWLRVLSFTANLPPLAFQPVTAHLWSLCLEVQFYVAIAVLVGLLGRRAFIVLPFLGFFVTLMRILGGAYASPITYYRADEILAGCMLALVFEKKKADANFLSAIPFWVVVTLFVASCSEIVGPLMYLRPYLAAWMVGKTIVDGNSNVVRWLSSKNLAYIASISYALYVVHPALAHTWLGSGDLVVKYLKRPLLFLAIWAVAHASTRYYEAYFIELGRHWVSRYGSPKQAGSKA